MNQKKCPKCGELNPPEAVMCWACYTPLTGPATAATAGAGPLAGGKAVAAAAPEEEAKKPAATPAQMGIIGVALVVGLLYGGYAMFGGGGGNQTFESFNATGGNGGSEGIGESGPVPPKSGGTDIMPPPPVNGGNPGAPPTTDTAFSVVAAPSPNSTRGTLGIYSPNSNLNQGQARDLARSAVRTLAQNQWKPLSVYVFNDAGAAAQFKEYQAQRGNKPLTGSDYPGLSQIWAHTVMYYQYTNGKEVMLNPSSNATGWWNRRA